MFNGYRVGCAQRQTSDPIGRRWIGRSSSAGNVKLTGNDVTSVGQVSHRVFVGTSVERILFKYFVLKTNSFYTYF